MNLQKNMSLLEKLTILSDAAKYDVACRWQMHLASEDFIYQ